MSQAPQHFRSSAALTIFDGCFAQRSCFNSSMSRTVLPKESSKVDVDVLSWICWSQSKTVGQGNHQKFSSAESMCEYTSTCAYSIVCNSDNSMLTTGVWLCRVVWTAVPESRPDTGRGMRQTSLWPYGCGCSTVCMTTMSPGA